MPKANVARKGRSRHGPLDKQILNDRNLTVEGKVKKGTNEKQGKEKFRLKKIKAESLDKDEEDVDDLTRKKILLRAREQQIEIEEEDKEGAYAPIPDALKERRRQKNITAEEEADDTLMNALENFGPTEEEIDQSYQDTMKFMPSETEEALNAAFLKVPAPSRTLADIIEDKLKEAAEKAANPQKPKTPSLPPKVVEVYRSVGKVLKRWKSGRLPKAFKVVPAMSNWEEILYLTAPFEWSANAMYEATRLFASNLNPHMAQRFYNLVLLPRIRDDIQENKKLNYHLFRALHKATYKPQAFFKGIILPLCENGDCNLKEATVIAAAVGQASIPAAHSAVCLLKLSMMEYSGATSIFFKTLLNKKYSLPFKVINAVCAHFIQFVNDQRDLPVLWHQSLLVFVQRYKFEITPEQREGILAVVRTHFHHQIGPEIRRELAHIKKN